MPYNAGLAVSREREEGSFDMMLMTPLTSVEILIGKAVPPIVIGVLQSAMIFAVCRWWFDIPFAGSLALLFGVVLLFAASIVGLALMISAWAQTLQQSVVACFILLLPSLVLSGLMTPTAAMPEWMQTITILNPVRYGILVVRMIYFETAGISHHFRVGQFAFTDIDNHFPEDRQGQFGIFFELLTDGAVI